MRSTAFESLSSAIRLVIGNFRLLVWLAVVPILVTALVRAALLDVFTLETPEGIAPPVSLGQGAPGTEQVNMFGNVDPVGMLTVALVSLVLAAPFLCVWMRIGALGLDRMAADEVDYRFGRREIACLRAILLVLVGCFLMTTLVSLPAAILLGGAMGGEGLLLSGLLGASAALAFGLRVSPYVVAAALDRADITLPRALALTRGQGLRMVGATIIVFFAMFPLLLIAARLSAEVAPLFATDFGRNTAEAIITLVLDYLSFAIFAVFFARMFVASAPPAPVNDPN